jgi:hypothetical protein
MTIRPSIDEERLQNPASVHGTSEEGGCGVMPESQPGSSGALTVLVAWMLVRRASGFCFWYAEDWTQAVPLAPE